jgi:hypothetical protein
MQVFDNLVESSMRFQASRRDPYCNRHYRVVDGHTTETPRDNDANGLQRAVASITASAGASLFGRSFSQLCEWVRSQRYNERPTRRLVP